MEITNESLNSLLEQVKEDILKVLRSSVGYGMPINAIAGELGEMQGLSEKYPKWFVAYACESLVAENKVLSCNLYYLKTDTDYTYMSLDS